MKTTTALIITALLESKSADACRLSPEVKDNGERTIYRMFYPGSRYMIDYAEDYFLEAWQQFDTDQDGAHFGVWINKKKLMTLCYCEGDFILVVCTTPAAFNAEIQEVITFYSEAPMFSTLNEYNVLTRYYQDRSKFFIDTNPPHEIKD